MDTQYIIGIDLGTTNTALAFFDTTLAEDGASIEVQPVPQSINPGEVAEQALLPSFLYVPGELDFAKGSLALPWDAAPQFVVGELARKRGAENPVRLVASAKSWLSYAAVNRAAPILPWRSPDEVEKLSPVEASSRYLSYLRAAWNSQITGKKKGVVLEDQEIFLTVPASFDEEARELTLRAAQEAGLKQVTLLEEPQAAFYSWIERQGDRWRRRVKVGDLILVCDVGGGTTDFSLITVSEEEGELVLKRVAVGDHILLGGDNMDLALARLLAGRLEEQGHRIDTWQLQTLWHQCRIAKEKLFSDPKSQKQPITILGKGTKLVGGTIKTELTREDLNQVLVEGFFPRVASDVRPSRQRRIGFQELGLPYAADPAVSRHLARFLAEQSRVGPEAEGIRRGAAGVAAPTHVLFNGGVMKAAALQDRVVEILNGWLGEEGFEPVEVLEAPDLDTAVARGAVYYG
ncbi:MAG TPA: Hsp70 family protein, partial [Blastocatellia bacterium]|nr:Hsp70 family protein [Blastocatellia bacterium]